jgi:hypothetical protein
MALNCDYLIIGAGAMGMAFVDVLLSESDGLEIIMVDKHESPGAYIQCPWKSHSSSKVGIGVIRINLSRCINPQNITECQALPLSMMGISANFQLGLK